MYRARVARAPYALSAPLDIEAALRECGPVDPAAGAGERRTEGGHERGGRAEAGGLWDAGNGPDLNGGCALPGELDCGPEVSVPLQRLGVRVQPRGLPRGHEDLGHQVDREDEFGCAVHHGVLSEDDALSRGAGRERETTGRDGGKSLVHGRRRPPTTRFPRADGTIR